MGPLPPLRKISKPSPWQQPVFKSTRGQAIPPMQQYLQEQVPLLEYDETHPDANMINFFGTPVDMRQIDVEPREAPRMRGFNPPLPTEPITPPSAHEMYYPGGKEFPAATAWTPEKGGGPWAHIPKKKIPPPEKDPYRLLKGNMGLPAGAMAQDLARSSTALNEMFPGWPAGKLMQEMGPSVGVQGKPPGLEIYDTVPEQYQDNAGHPFAVKQEDKLYFPRKLPLSHWSGTLLHELRHIGDYRNDPWFKVDKNQNNPEAYNSFLEQPNHFANGLGDRAVAEMLTAQNIHRKTGRPLPPEILKKYPSMQGKPPERVPPLPTPEFRMRVRYPTFEKRK